MIKSNAAEILENRMAARREAQERVDLKKEVRNKELRDLLLDLMRGEPLTAEEGRRIMWECVCNGTAIHMEPMTGNAQTYHNLGIKKHAEDQVRSVKNLSFDLYQTMEKEARVRVSKED